MNDFVEVHRLLATALRRWWLLLLFTAITGTAGYLGSRQQAKVYEATTTVLVGQSIKSSQLERVDIQTSEALVQTYVDIARRQPVLDGVVQTLNLRGTWLDLRKRIEVNTVPDTQLIEIRVEANSPETARIIADEITNQLLLISPSGGSGAESDPIDTFNRDQILALQEKIVNGQRRLEAIEAAIDGPISEEELLKLQNEKIVLEGLIVEWGRNYTELLPFTVSQPDRDPNKLTVIETAHADDAPVRPRVQLNTILSGGVGLALALGLVFVLELVDDTYKSPNDLSRAENLKLLGSIRKFKRRKYSGQIIAHLEPRSPTTESYRIIRSRIRSGPADKLSRSILVTSSIQDEGKSATAANLAIVFAQANLKTIVVDADFRQPVLHRVFGVENDCGLGELLSSTDMNVEGCMKDTVVKNLRILTSGELPLEPSERLSSGRMMQILAKLNEMADIVIFDSPPVLVFADAVDLSRRVDGVILVLRAGKSQRDAVNQALYDLKSAGANLLGSIFTDSPRVRTVGTRAAYPRERAPFSFTRIFSRKAKPRRTQDQNLPELGVSASEENELTPMEQILEVQGSAIPAHEEPELVPGVETGELLEAAASARDEPELVSLEEAEKLSEPVTLAVAEPELVSPEEAQELSEPVMPPSAEPELAIVEQSQELPEPPMPAGDEHELVIEVQVQDLPESALPPIDDSPLAAAEQAEELVESVIATSEEPESVTVERAQELSEEAVYANDDSELAVVEQAQEQSEPLIPLSDEPDLVAEVQAQEMPELAVPASDDPELLPVEAEQTQELPELAMPASDEPEPVVEEQTQELPELALPVSDEPELIQVQETRESPESVVPASDEPDLVAEAETQELSEPAMAASDEVELVVVEEIPELPELIPASGKGLGSKIDISEKGKNGHKANHRKRTRTKKARVGAK